MNAQIKSLTAEVCRLRNKLLELAKECAECGGTGVRTVHVDENGMLPLYEHPGPLNERQLPCPQCADIREVLE